MSNVYQYKLSNGDEIIGEEVEVGKGGPRLANAVLIRREIGDQYDPGGNLVGQQMYYGMGSWFLNQFSENDKGERECNDVLISKHSVIAKYEPTKSVLKLYADTVKILKKNDPEEMQDLDEEEEDDSDGPSNVVRPNFGNGPNQLH